MFELDLKVIKKLVSKLIFSKKLNAAIDSREDSLIFYSSEISKVQQLGKDLLGMVKH